MTMTDAGPPTPQDEYYRAAAAEARAMTKAMNWTARLSGCMLWAILLPLGLAAVLFAIGCGILIFG